MTNYSALTSIVIPCYRDASGAIRAVSALLAMLGEEARRQTQLLVIDDGSQDDSALRISNAVGSEAQVLALETNRGRASARNIGVREAVGEYVVFMDCDCTPLTDIVQAHTRALADGVVASAGSVHGSGDNGFWDRYQRAVSRRRERLHDQGVSFSGSSQNLAVRRSEFLAVGGFDQAYERYGFEDRDLLIRLAQRGNIALNRAAIVQHHDRLTLMGVCRKMTETGRYSSGRFRQKFPDEYRVLGYEAADVANTSRPWLRGVASLGPGLIKPAAVAFDALERRLPLPLWLAAPVVRGLSGLAYLHGTSLRE